MFEIKSNFIGNFKIGDNIVYNLKTLGILYSDYHKTPENQKYLHKPIIIIIVSIIEAVLYDFNLRVHHFTNEGVPNILKKDLQDMRNKDIKRFHQHIENARNYNLFPTNEKFYDCLQELRKLRNRVHIQNEKKYFEADEAEAFSFDRMIQAEQILEIIFRMMEKHYPRGEQYAHVKNFALPWSRHFPSL